jgi:hypothetical protein
MPGLDARDLHLDQFLTNILIGYKPQGLIGDQLFPVIPVQKQTNVYAQIDRGNWFRVPSTRRAPLAKPSEVQHTVSSGMYVCLNYELATRVAYETMDNADAPHNPMQRAGEFLIDQLMLDFENRVQQVVTTGCGSSKVNAAGTTAAWDDFASSDPITDCEVGAEAIRQKTGYKPNIMVIGYRAWLKIRRHPDIIRASYPGAGVGGLVTPEQFAKAVMVDKVIVAEPIKNTTEEGQADSFTDVWSTNCILAYIAPRPGIMVPTFGYCFRWTGANIGNNGPSNFGMYTKRDDETKSQYLQTGYYQDERIIAPELGFLIQTGVV